MNSGIYLIRNLVNDKVYIGQSVNVKARLSDHRRLLSQNKHNNSYLQRQYNKYGVDCFEFSKIETASLDKLDDAERFWIELYNSMDRNKGFNLESGGNAGKTFSKQRIEQITGAGNPMFGKKRSKEFVDFISLFNRGSSDKLTEADVSNIKEFLFNNASQSELANKYGVSLSTINKIVKCKNWGWVREDLNEALIKLADDGRSNRLVSAKELYSQGMALREISVTLQCDRKYLSRVLRKETQHDKDQLAEKYSNVLSDFIKGISRETIKKTHGISQTVYNRITSGAFNDQKKELINKVHKLKSEGMPINKIAALLGLHRTTVTEIMKRTPTTEVLFLCGSG
jgi:group I intron endonuclease